MLHTFSLVSTAAPLGKENCSPLMGSQTFGRMPKTTSKVLDQQPG